MKLVIETVSAPNKSSSCRDERLIAFLQSASSYPHRPREVRLIQTHISWVFIASPFVFKVKKPVNLGFLDFSTLEKRHHFCQRELELNRRLCPETYGGFGIATAMNPLLRPVLAFLSFPLRLTRGAVDAVLTRWMPVMVVFVRKRSLMCRGKLLVPR
jgi:hypothetical protein